MTVILERLIATAGNALENEDRYLLGAAAGNGDVYRGDPSGILRINNERYYQFIVARSLMSSMPYRVRVEVDTHDLVLESPKDGARFAVVEMKRWMSERGETELPGIRNDIQGKLQRAPAELKVMLIFSSNPRDDMHNQLAWLSDRLQIAADAWKTYCFSTINKEGKSFDFWVAGYQVV